MKGQGGKRAYVQQTNGERIFDMMGTVVLEDARRGGAFTSRQIETLQRIFDMVNLVYELADSAAVQSGLCRGTLIAAGVVAEEELDKAEGAARAARAVDFMFSSAGKMLDRLLRRAGRDENAQGPGPGSSRKQRLARQRERGPHNE